MKMNKKLLAIMTSLTIMGTILVGCGNQSQEVTETPVVEETVTEEAPETTETPEEPVAPETTENEGVVGEVDPTAAQELFFVVTDGIELPMSNQMPAEMFADTYGIDTSLLESCYVAMPMMNVHATEIAIFELKDESSQDAVMAGIEKRQKALEDQWASYLPEQLELVKNYKTAVKGNKVIFVVSESSDQIIEKFNTLA